MLSARSEQRSQTWDTALGRHRHRSLHGFTAAAAIESASAGGPAARHGMLGHRTGIAAILCNMPDAGQPAEVIQSRHHHHMQSNEYILTVKHAIVDEKDS
jgi:hypothetical protein